MNKNLQNQAVNEVNINTDKLKNDVIALNAELEKLLQRQNELTTSGEKNTKAYQDVATQVRIAKDAIKENTAQIDSNIKALNLSKGSLEQNKALLQSLQNQYTALSQAEGDHSKELTQLNTLLQTVSQSVERQEKKVANSREVFDLHKGSVDALKGSFERLAPVSGDFGSTLQDATTGFNMMKQGLTAVKTGFTSVGGAIKTTGFGLLLLVLESLVEYFTKNKEGITKLKGAISAVGKVVDMIRNTLAGFGESIFNAFLHPVDSLKALSNAIKENVINRLNSVKVILDGIVHLDFKKIGDGVLQAFTGVTHVSDKMSKAFISAKQGIINLKNEAINAYNAGRDNAKNQQNDEKKTQQQQTQIHQTRIKQVNETTNILAQANEERIASQTRMSQTVLEGYAKEIADTNAHFKELKKKYQASATTVEQLEREHAATLAAINEKFQNEDLKKLDDYQKELNKASMDARALALQQLQEDYSKQAKDLEKIQQDNTNFVASYGEEIAALQKQKQTAETQNLINDLKNKQDKAQETVDKAKTVIEQLKAQYDKSKSDTNNTFDKKPLEEAVQKDKDSGNWQQEYQDRAALLKMEYDQAVAAAKEKGESTAKVEEEYSQKKLKLDQDAKVKQGKLDKDRMAAEAANQKQYLQTLDKLSGAVGNIFGKNTVAAKAAFKAHQAAAAAQVIIDTKQAIMGIWSSDARLPIIGVPKAIAETAIVAAAGASNLASILKQKPGFAQGGQYLSDGRGALLSGYSRHDNTNAYLRSGEAVVVSEAMRNPWARNLVSAINVAYGGRDFSIPNPSRGYAIGGIFTDGGNANRYYSQPVNDQKDLANTLAYQMLNNFPPIYVDVKDINNQQNILAQTVNRVNL
ncbi:hypothetical protein HH214_04320 [Mucilaginibacter robiniae]|uniref:Uncharacterized protein n=1 Tax=Mucilaginibacter robiniae TaxID=2728022 RepID=A0A7L5DY82_9SPHI|nr:hypothetical protein [Mucilaginibacter robiniae]QJD95158.1 hypothetical protein HH214_04320 [Mucilaginibacter robiniae]